MVKNFTEWCTAVEAERAKLYAVTDLREEMPRDTQIALTSTHLCAALHRLLKIAEEDENNA